MRILLFASLFSLAFAIDGIVQEIKALFETMDTYWIAYLPTLTETTALKDWGTGYEPKDGFEKWYERFAKREYKALLEKGKKFTVNELEISFLKEYLKCRTRNGFQLSSELIESHSDYFKQLKGLKPAMHRLSLINDLKDQSDTEKQLVALNVFPVDCKQIFPLLLEYKKQIISEFPKNEEILSCLSTFKDSQQKKELKHAYSALAKKLHLTGKKFYLSMFCRKLRPFDRTLSADCTSSNHSQAKDDFLQNTSETVHESQGPKVSFSRQVSTGIPSDSLSVSSEATSIISDQSHRKQQVLAHKVESNGEVFWQVQVSTPFSVIIGDVTFEYTETITITHEQSFEFKFTSPSSEISQDEAEETPAKSDGQAN